MRLMALAAQSGSMWWKIVDDCDVRGGWPIIDPIDRDRFTTWDKERVIQYDLHRSGHHGLYGSDIYNDYPHKEENRINV